MDLSTLSINASQLDHLIHKMYLDGELSKLTSLQIKNILYSLKTATNHDPVKEMDLDHLIHALRLSGDLAKLTSTQLDNILYAFKAAGHFNYLTDVRNASYNDGHLISFHNADFLDDPLFSNAYKLGTQTDSWQNFDIRWRVYIMCWAGYYAKGLAGDYVECGVNRGGFSRAVMHYINFQNLYDRTFYLLDTFDGIPKEDHHLVDLYKDAYTDCYVNVVETFKDFQNVQIIKGKVPDTLSQVSANKICYLSIDMNYAMPEIAALDYFYDKLVPGAIVILDDYGAGKWHINQKKAFDEFAVEKGIKILTLPTCQGLIIKSK